VFVNIDSFPTAVLVAPVVLLLNAPQPIAVLFAPV